tara:strand:- start:112 stop:357 length:246 start_codon:yes stop_codon:yes gene_type:complete
MEKIKIEFLNSKKAAEFLGISKSTLYKLTSKREINYSKPGGKLIYFQKKDLEDYLQKGSQPNLMMVSDSIHSSLEGKKTFY